MPDPSDLSEVAQTIRSARRERRWSQTDLAHHAGLSRPTVARLEQGAEGLSLGNLYKVLKALGLTVSVQVPPAKGGPGEKPAQTCPIRDDDHGRRQEVHDGHFTVMRRLDPR